MFICFYICAYLLFFLGKRLYALRAYQSPLLRRKAIFFRESRWHGRPLQIGVFARALGQVIMTAKEFSRSGHCRSFAANRTGFHDE